jgi:protein SCO1/2
LIKFYLLLTFLISFNAFPLGGTGPMALGKDGLQNKKPVVLDKIGIEEHLGDQINLELKFKDEKGEDVVLGKYFKEKPVFLLLIYYECPTLCSLHLNSLMTTFKELEWNIGDKYDLVAVSIDPDESPKLAQKKLDSYLKEYGRPETRDGWHFLTGEEDNIKELASQIGFKYAWDPREQQWAHTAAGYILTPEGKISFYHYGLQIEKKVLRLSLVEAANHKIGTLMDRALLFCLQYDPTKKTYAFYAYNVMRLGGIITILFLSIFLFRFWKKENKTQDKGNDL